MNSSVAFVAVALFSFATIVKAIVEVNQAGKVVTACGKYCESEREYVLDSKTWGKMIEQANLGQASTKITFGEARGDKTTVDPKAFAAICNKYPDDPLTKKVEAFQYKNTDSGSTTTPPA